VCHNVRYHAHLLLKEGVIQQHAVALHPESRQCNKQRRAVRSFRARVHPVIGWWLGVGCRLPTAKPAHREETQRTTHPWSAAPASAYRSYVANKSNRRLSAREERQPGKQDGAWWRSGARLQTCERAHLSCRRVLRDTLGSACRQRPGVAAATSLVDAGGGSKRVGGARCPPHGTTGNPLHASRLLVCRTRYTNDLAMVRQRAAALGVI